MKAISVLIIGLLCICCTQNKLSKFYFLEGIWKIEGKEQYEFWELNTDKELEGKGYKLVDGQKVILETLRIKEQNGLIVYQATVVDQNKGDRISFIWNESDNSCFSFENKNHDFPKKIKYKKLTDTELEIRVLGDQDKGFSFIQKKE